MSSLETETLATRNKERLQDAAAAIADNVKSVASETLADGVAAVNDAYGHAREKTAEVFGEAEGYLRDKTFLTLGIVAGAGLLLGYALRGRGRAAKAVRDETRPQPRA